MVDLGPSRFAKVQGTSSLAFVCTYAIDSIPFVLFVMAEQRNSSFDQT